MTDHSPTILKKLTGLTGRFFSLSLALLLIFVLLRLLDISVLFPVYHFPAGYVKPAFLGLWYDLLVCLRMCGFLVVPFILLSLVHRSVATVFFISAGCITVLLSLSLQFYFVNSLLPLGSDLFAYSWDEIKHTAGSAGGVSGLVVFLFIGFTGLALFLLLFFQQKIFPPAVFLVFYIFIAISFIFTLNPGPKNFKTDFDSYLASNKFGYFCSKSFDYFAGPKKTVNPAECDMQETGTGTADFTYVSSDYPFLHTDETRDVLGNFFAPRDTTPPNIVFILVESLGSAYSGEHACLGSFTPFLDSLAQHGLYWENFLSTGGRTFAVLPSILASLPFAEKGFIEMREKMPRHLSLVKLLKQRGYFTSFLFGGDARFDGMDVFMQRQGTDRITDIGLFGMGYEKLPSNEEGFTWGYGDREIFRKYLDITAGPHTKPRLDIILTVAMHSPFAINNQDYYSRLFEKHLEGLNIPADMKPERKSYAKQYATVLCFDDALRYFMGQYARRSDFANTIFIITGDHRMPEIPLGTQLDRFHVPLLIYSPLLKRTAKFLSVSTQFDITPSLTAFLRDNYGFQFPAYAHWIGFGLDTARVFRNIHSYPLMRNKNELIDYIDGTNFLANDNLYQVYPNMDIEAVNNVGLLGEIQRKFDKYKATSQMVCSQGRLVPDSVFAGPSQPTLSPCSVRKMMAQRFAASALKRTYSIVVSVFDNSNDAMGFKEKLDKSGFPARITREGWKYVVLTGPYASKEKAGNDLASIRASWDAYAWMVRDK
jgi:hypothetical protein